MRLVFLSKRQPMPVPLRRRANQPEQKNRSHPHQRIISGHTPGIRLIARQDVTSDQGKTVSRTFSPLSAPGDSVVVVSSPDRRLGWSIQPRPRSVRSSRRPQRIARSSSEPPAVLKAWAIPSAPVSICSRRRQPRAALLRSGRQLRRLLADRPITPRRVPTAPASYCWMPTSPPGPDRRPSSSWNSAPT